MQKQMPQQIDMAADLFPETLAAGSVIAGAPEWSGALLDRWDGPRIRARLIPQWNSRGGWVVGWFVKADQCLDEWAPAAPDAWRAHSHYPWYRPEEMPCSAIYAVACGQAARMLKIVMEQFIASGYLDAELANEMHSLQAQIETQARAWLTGAASC